MADEIVNEADSAKPKLKSKLASIGQDDHENRISDPTAPAPAYVASKKKKPAPSLEDMQKKMRGESAEAEDETAAVTEDRLPMDAILSFAANKDAVGFATAIKNELDYRLNARIAQERSVVAKDLARTVRESSGDPDYYDTQDLKSDELAKAEKEDKEKKKAKVNTAKK